MPWLLVGILAACTGLGMGISLVDQPVPAQTRIAQILNSTEKAGTARFSITSTTNIDTQTLRSGYRSSGQINFRTGAMSVTIHYLSAGLHGNAAGTPVAPDLKFIVTGRFFYVYEQKLLSSVGVNSSRSTVSYFWSKSALSPHSRERSDILTTFGPLALLQLVASTEAPQIDDLGPGTVGGEKATKYQIGALSCHSTTDQVSEQISSTPVSLWVDGTGDLCRVK